MKKILNSFFISHDDISLLVSADVRRRKILNTMLMIMSTTTIFSLVFYLGMYIAEPAAIPNKEEFMLFISCLIGLSGFALIKLINHHVSSDLAGIIFLLVLYAAFLTSDTLHEIALGRALIFMLLPVVIAGILIRPWGGIVIAFINAVVISYIAALEGEIPNIPAIWSFFVVALLVWQSTSILERALEDMQKNNQSLLEAEERIQQINAGLEQRVAERTAELRITNDQLRVEMIERKQADAALQESEERLQGYSVGNFVGVYLTGLDNPIDVTLPTETQIDLIYENAYMAECNQALAQMYGLPSPEIMIGMRLIDAHGGKDEAVNRDVFRKWIENGYKSLDDETLEYTPDGKPLWFLSNTIGIIENGYLIRTWGTAIAITERKLAEEALRESNERYRSLIELSPDPIVIIQDEQYKMVSSAFYDMFGYTREDVADGLSIFKVIQMQDVQTVRDRDTEMIIGRPSPTIFNIDLIGKGGRIFPCESSTAEIQHNGKRAYLTILRDVTERRHAEEALQESEILYRQMFNNHSAVMRLVDPDTGLIVDANPAASDFYGYSIEALQQLTVQQLNVLPPDKTSNLLREARERKQNFFTAPHRLASGKIRQVEIHSVPIRVKGRELLYSIIHDVTERKRLEKSLKESNLKLEARVEKRTSELLKSRERMNYLARQVMTAQEEERKRIAEKLHDEAGELLIGLKSPLNMIYNQLPASKDAQRQIIAKAMNLANEVAQRIRTMSYSLHPPMLDIMGLNMSIKSYCKEFSENTEIQVICDCENADLEDASNAIKLSSYRFVWEALANVHKHADANKVDVSLTHENGYITVSVHDNGRGMVSKSKDGYGIGLRGIEERIGILGGMLKINSKSGKGTQMQMVLPWKNDGDQVFIKGEV